jgi:hypothetical protein
MVDEFDVNLETLETRAAIGCAMGEARIRA